MPLLCECYTGNGQIRLARLRVTFDRGPDDASGVLQMKALLFPAVLASFFSSFFFAEAPEVKYESSVPVSDSDSPTLPC